MPIRPRAITCLACALMLIPAAAGQPAGTVPHPAEPTIHVNGTARVERTPDFVDISLGVEVRDKLAGAAQAGAEKTTRAVLDAVKGLGLAGVDLQPGVAELEPQYDDRDRHELRAILGYDAVITLKVRTTDLNAPARVIDAALKAGATRVEGVEFGIKEAIAAREDAIKLAAEAAKRKGRILASALDLKLGRVIRAETSSGTGGWWPRNRSASNMAQMASSGPAGGDDQGPIIPGKVEVWADVDVTWEVGG